MDALVEALVPGMPAPARAEITAQAQGIPLFAVETMRSLIDRDVVQPIEGATGSSATSAQLAVPDSLHALLAARLDALDPAVRQLVADAAVLGTTFPAEALIAVSGQDEAVVRAALAELVRREVLTVSAEPAVARTGQLPVHPEHAPPGRLRHPVPARPQGPPPHGGRSPARRLPRRRGGSRRVIARHYLDALEAVPGPPMPKRSVGRQSQRSSAQLSVPTAPALPPGPQRATPPRPSSPRRVPPGGQDTAAALWEHAADAALTNADFATAVQRADLARNCYLQSGDSRAAARAQAITGQALRRWGHHAQAREQLTAAVEVLRAGPDANTVRALEELAALEMFAGAPDADRLTTEALALGQALGASAGQLTGLFTTRGVYHGMLAAILRRSPTSARPHGWPHRPPTTSAWESCGHRAAVVFATCEMLRCDGIPPRRRRA